MAKQSYEEQFGLAVRHGKMTEDRKQELLAKVERVASNDTTVFAGTDYDIKVDKNSENGSIVIDMVAHIMKSDENEPDKMNVSYAAAYCMINNAAKDTQEKASELVRRIIKSSISGLSLEGGNQERALIEQSLY